MKVYKVVSITPDIKARVKRLSDKTKLDQMVLIDRMLRLVESSPEIYNMILGVKK